MSQSYKISKHGVVEGELWGWGGEGERRSMKLAYLRRRGGVVHREIYRYVCIRGMHRGKTLFDLV